jgi:hypothetical protein
MAAPGLIRMARQRSKVSCAFASGVPYEVWINGIRALEGFA